MGYGYWTRESFVDYSAAKGRAVDAAGRLDGRLTDQQIFRQRSLHPLLDPRNAMRECCDSDDHPRSVPVLLALDVTGSMGAAAAEVAKKINEVMAQLYNEIRDVEFMVMGIGDLAYDRAPIQISQFEADIRIAEQLDLVYMEHGGGGNAFESYTAAWYMGLYHTRLDCWKRGEKGLIITMGDEPLNPYLPRGPLAAATGDALQADVETRALYAEASARFEIRHLHVLHRNPDHYLEGVRNSFGRLLPRGHLMEVGLDDIAGTLVSLIADHARGTAGQAASDAIRREDDDAIRWDTGDAPEAEVPAAEKPAKRQRLGRLLSWL